MGEAEKNTHGKYGGKGANGFDQHLEHISTKQHLFADGAEQKHDGNEEGGWPSKVFVWNRLQVRDIQNWLNSVRRTCQCCAQGKDASRPPAKRRCCAVGACCEDSPSARTVSDIRGTLRSALSQAVLEDLVAKNVAALVKLPTPRAKKRKAWSSEEARRFLESARTDNDPLYAAYSWSSCSAYGRARYSGSSGMT